MSWTRIEREGAKPTPLVQPTKKHRPGAKSKIQTPGARQAENSPSRRERLRRIARGER